MVQVDEQELEFTLGIVQNLRVRALVEHRMCVGVLFFVQADEIQNVLKRISQRYKQDTQIHCNVKKLYLLQATHIHDYRLV